MAVSEKCAAPEQVLGVSRRAREYVQEARGIVEVWWSEAAHRLFAGGRGV